MKTSGGQTGQSSNNSIVIERTSATLLDGIRKYIRDTKRRLIFTHTRVWVLDEALAKDNTLQPLDLIIRDQMVRLSSYLFITQNDPSEILKTHGLFKNIQSLELATSMKTGRFVSDYPVVMIRDVYKMISSPVEAAYIPMIRALMLLWNP